MFLAMKTVKQVKATRKTYHKDPTLNTIHRASLLVPEIQNTVAEISFLNHFLLKRQLLKFRIILFF